MGEVEILLALYNPDSRFLIKQLNSIDQQTYKHIHLRIRDDCSNNRLDIKKILDRCLNNVSFELKYNQNNFGSNKTFELLTEEAQGDYLAYCDQDDIWEPEKIEMLVKKIKKKEASLCYSNMKIINERGELISKSFKKYSKRIKLTSGENKYSFFMRRNSVTGCAMLIKNAIAKKALPFPSTNQYVHDHWLALIASFYGEIAFETKPLVNYRIHSNNQIGAKFLNEVNDKDNYITKLNSERLRIYTIQNKIHNDKKVLYELNKYESFVNIRIAFAKNSNLVNMFSLFKIIHKDPKLIIFELIFFSLSNQKARKFITKIKN